MNETILRRSSMAAVVAALLWTQPGLAYTCDDQLQACQADAWRDPDPRVQDIKLQECSEQYDICVSSPVCGDGVCQSSESCSTCSADCGTGESTRDLGTEKRNCSSPVYVYSRETTAGMFYWHPYCYFPIYDYFATTCEVYRRYEVLTCGGASTIQEVYQGTSTDYSRTFSGQYYPVYGTCPF